MEQKTHEQWRVLEEELRRLLKDVEGRTGDQQREQLRLTKHLQVRRPSRAGLKPPSPPLRGPRTSMSRARAGRVDRSHVRLAAALDRVLVASRAAAGHVLAAFAGWPL